MIEIFIPAILFGIWITFSIIFINKYKKLHSSSKSNTFFWNNNYVFESIPAVFPTLGIFCTALGITIGIWNFDASDIQNSIPELLRGLKLAFIATMAGIFGLIVFQKYNAIVQKKIDSDPNRPKVQSDELSAMSEMTTAVQELKKENKKQMDQLIKALGDDLENKVGIKIESLKGEISKLLKQNAENQDATSNGLTILNNTTEMSKKEIVNHLEELKNQQKLASELTNKNTDEIIKAMSENNKLTAKKFDEFSELLKKNNTEALVEVMKRTTEQFNAQMSELINKLVQENFAELNDSVLKLNQWQQENKEQIQKLTQQFERTTEMFTISATTLKEVAFNTQVLTAEDSKLSQIVEALNKVMIEDSKFQDITYKLTNTIETLKKTTDSFDETTSKLNDWIRTERNFKEAAEILIVKLEEFRDFNGDVWEKYRNEMSKAISIVKETSTRLSGDLSNINAEFYERLSNTLQNLDDCIQRFIPNQGR